MPLYREKPCHLAEVLGGSGEEKLVFCAIWSPKAQSIQLQYAFQMREQHLDLLPFSPMVLRELARQNKPDGFMCASCAWPKPADHHPAEFCEEGAKATAWELTSYRTTPEFFQQHTLTELRSWPDYDLEQHGRLTQCPDAGRASCRGEPRSRCQVRPRQDLRMRVATPIAFERITASGLLEPHARPIAEEMPVAIECNGIGYAVLMASPCDLIDLAMASPSRSA